MFKYYDRKIRPKMKIKQNKNTGQDLQLPCEGMEIEPPSICFSRTGHSLGNSIADQRNTYLSVHFKYSMPKITKTKLKQTTTEPKSTLPLNRDYKYNGLIQNLKKIQKGSTCTTQVLVEANKFQVSKKKKHIYAYRWVIQ